MPSVRFISSPYQSNQLKHMKKNVHLTRYSGSIDSSTKIDFFKKEYRQQTLAGKISLFETTQWMAGYQRSCPIRELCFEVEKLLLNNNKKVDFPYSILNTAYLYLIFKKTTQHLITCSYNWHVIDIHFLQTTTKNTTPPLESLFRNSYRKPCY